MDYYKIIEQIKQTGQRGQELLIDSFIIGIAYGRQIIQSYDQIQMAIQRLFQIKLEIDNGNQSPFLRDKLFKKFIEENDSTIFNYNPHQIQGKDKQNIQEQHKSYGQCKWCTFIIEEKEWNKIICLQCQHYVHIACLYQQLQKNQYKCKQCNQQISDQIITHIQTICDKKKQSFCPSLDCKGTFIYHNNTDEHQCQQCEKLYCLKCFKEKQKNHKCQNTLKGTKILRYKYCNKCDVVFDVGNLEISNMNIDHECKKRGVLTNFLYKWGKATEKQNDEY